MVLKWCIGGRTSPPQTPRQHGFSEPLVGPRRGRLPETQVTLLSSMRLLVPSGLLPDEMMEVLLGDLVVGRDCWDNTGRLRGAQLDLCLESRWESECHRCLYHPGPAGPLQPHEGWALLGNYRHIGPNAEASAPAVSWVSSRWWRSVKLLILLASRVLFACYPVTQQHVPPWNQVDILFSRIRNTKITTKSQTKPPAQAFLLCLHKYCHQNVRPPPAHARLLDLCSVKQDLVLSFEKRRMEKQLCAII